MDAGGGWADTQNRLSPDLTPPVDDAIDHHRGDPDALASIVMFGDYECPFARAAFRSVQRIERGAEPVRFVFRHFPLFEIHPHALNAALAAETASLSGRFWEMHELLFGSQERLGVEDLQRLAASLSIASNVFDAGFTSEAVAARVQRDLRAGEMSAVTGTPTLFINGFRHAGRHRTVELSAAVDRARAAARATRTVGQGAGCGVADAASASTASPAAGSAWD